MKIQADNRLVFIGDSITSGARDFAMGGEGTGNNAYGDSYVRIVKSMIESFYPELRIRVTNRGIGGNTIRHMAARWREDTVDLKPDWLSVMIGINDVWRQFDSPMQKEIHVHPEEFMDTYRRILQQIRPQLEGLVICSPYVIDDNPNDPMRRRMDEYREMSEAVAKEFGAIYVDTQAPFDAYLKHHHSNHLCADRIHPSTTGHMLIARAWLDAVNFAWCAKE